MTPDTHIGKLMRDIAKKRNVSTKYLAEKLGYTLDNIYKIFKRRLPDYELVMRISNILDYDFASHLPFVPVAHRQLIIQIADNDTKNQLLNYNANVHIGTLMHKIIKERNIPIGLIADQLGYTKRNIYKIFERCKPDYDIVLRISALLEYDFTIYLQLQTIQYNQFIILVADDELLEKLRNNSAVEIIKAIDFNTIVKQL